MHFLSLIFFYVHWHYTEGFKDLSRNWKSFLLFVLHFFSLKLMFRTWLSPFGRLNEVYKKEFNMEDFFETLVVNTLMRIVGFVLRTFVIIIGFLVLTLMVLLGPLVLVLWVLIPLAVFFLFFLGIITLLS